MTFHRSLILTGTLCLGLLACSDNSTSVDPTELTPNAANNDTPALNIVETAGAAGSFNTLTTALQLTGLDQVLADPDRVFTVFAPTDAAFAALDEGALNTLLNDVDALRSVLLYHVLADVEVPASQAIALDGQLVEAASGDSLAITTRGDALFVNAAQVTSADVGASNGVIHVIDAVLLRPGDGDPDASNLVETAVGAGSFSTLVSALQLTGLDAVLADESRAFTVFAPTDAAFAALAPGVLDGLLNDVDRLRELLLYHVLADQRVAAVQAGQLDGQTLTAANGEPLPVAVTGAGLRIGNAAVQSADIGATNGVIHVIDAVLERPGDDTGAPGNLVEVARAGGFNTLLAALNAAGLADTLADAHRQFTVFAPTDAAFDAIGADALASLLADEARLRDVLLFHVVADSVIDSAAVPGLLGQAIHAANGDALVFSEAEGELRIQSSTIVRTDVRASNGVVHVIDAVMLPPAH